MSSRSHHRRPNGPTHSMHVSGAGQPRAAARRLGPLRLSAAVVTWLAALAVLCVVGALSPVVADDGTGDPATTAATGATDPGATDPAVTDPSAAPDPAADPPVTTSDPSGPTAPSDTSGSGGAGTGSTGVTQKPSTSRLAALADPTCTSGTVVGTFEIDGNTPPCTDDDWGTPKGNHVVDPTGGADTSNFTSGSKEFANPASWSTGTGTAPNKDDVKDVYLYNTTVGGDIYSYFGFSRVAVNGTTSYDIEYNQKPNLTANPPRPNRTPGDLLVQVEQHGNKAFEFVLDGAFLWTLKTDPSWSSSCIPVPSSPGQPDAGWCQKNVPAGAFTGATSDDGFFAEGALDISTLYGDGTCIGDFGRINIRSWASNAGTAELKDWVEPQPVNIQGTCADIFIEKVDKADPTKHIGGATYEITPDPTPGSSALKLTVTDNGPNDLDPADGFIKVSPVEPGSYAVKETVAPTGYFLPSPQTQGPQAVPKSGSYTFVFKDKRQWKAPTISKDAAGSYDASYDWSIAKTVGNPGEQKPDDKAAQNVPEGTSATFDYGVTVTEGAEHRTNYRVTGKVSVGNANADAMRVTLSDTLSDNTGCTFPGATDVDAAAGLQVDVPAGGKDYAYTCSPGANPSAGTNTASVSWDTSKYPQTQAQADSGSGTDSRSASAAYSYTPTTVTNKTVHVVDDKTVAGASNALGTITWSAQGTEHPFTYSLTFPGTAGQCTDYTNQATIVETAQDASATATVCVGRNLTVTKNKVASLTRTYHYSIAKVADDTTLEADPTTGKATAHYTVTVTDGAATDSDWVMTGSIEVTNPNAWESISLTGISDTYSGDQAQSCTVDQAPGLTIGAGAKKTYSYSCLFASQPAYNGTNVATVTWDKAQAATPKGDASGSAAVVEADWALSKVDATVHVVDDKTVPGQSHDLGTVTWTAKGTQHTFGYDLDLQGVPGQCKAYPNIATISETQDSATETVTVCAPQAITVTKTATGTYDRTYLWTIEKQVDKTRVDIDGGTARFNYTVAATPNGYQDSGWTMGGSITVSNPNAFKSVTAHVTDVPSAGPGASCTVANGGDVTVPAGHVVNGAVVPGTASLAYSCTVPNEPIYAASTNTAYATWDGGSADTGAVPVGFTLAKETNKTVDVTDDKTTPIPQALGTATWNAASTPTTFGYHLDLPGVDGQCTTYDNTAAITQTGQDSSQSVQVCQQKALVVAKTVHAGYDRTYLWTIAKAADKTSVEISSGGTATFHYTVTVTPDGVTDSGYVMSGSISVTNPNSAAVGSITADVVDVPSVGDGITCAVTGGSGVAIAAGATVQLPYTCTFGGHVPSSSGTNTATASWQGNQGARSASDTEDVDFTLKGETNKTIDVVDDKTVAGQSIALGTASWDDGAKSFGYDLDLQGVAGTCTPYTNTATITQTQQDATQTVNVCVESPLDVSKSVDASFHRTYLWDLAKNADQTRVEVTDADSALFHYTVTATPGSYVDSGYDLHGTITVHNPNGYEGGSITANVSDLPHVGAGITCAVPGGSGATVAPGQTRTFDYTCSFGAATPQYTGGTNEAKVDWTGPGDVARTGSDVKDVTFGIGGTTDKTVTVTDDKTDPQHPVVLGTATWNADGTPTVFAYDLELTGQVGQCLPFTNTAVLDLEHADDIVKQATVTLCVQANAVLANVVNASYDRSYAWSIDKAADQTHVDVGSNGKATVNYTVNVTPGAATDSGWEMSGSLTVGNPNEYKSLTVTVANITDLGAGVTCPLDPGQDMTVPASGSTTYTYTCAIADQPAYTGTDTATVTWDKGSVSLDTPIAFALDQETNRTVTVVDDKTVPGESHTLGTAEWNEAGTPVPFTYSLALGAAANKCQDYTNTATIVETEQSDDATVTVCGPSVKPDEAGRPRPGTPAAVEGVESSLPNTGGPHGVYVWSGAALVLAGCGLLLWSRRRRSES